MDFLRVFFNFLYSNVDILWYSFGFIAICAVIAILLVNKKRQDDFYKSMNKYRKEQDNEIIRDFNTDRKNRK